MPDLQQEFVNELSCIVASKGITKSVFAFNNSSDMWTQDFVKPGYTSMPGPNGTISMRIMIRSVQDHCGGEIHCGTNTVRQIDQPWW